MGPAAAEEASEKRGRIRSFMTWLGYGPESELPDRAGGDSRRARARAEAVARRERRKVERRRRREARRRSKEQATGARIGTRETTAKARSQAEAERKTQREADHRASPGMAAEPAGAPGAGASASEEPRPPAAGDATPADLPEAIRIAEATAAEAATRRAVDEILALEQDLDRVKVEAAARLEELEGGLAELESRAHAAERRVEDAHTRLADSEARAAQSWVDAEKARRELAEISRRHAQVEAERRLHESAERRLESECAGLRRELEALRVQAAEQVRDASERGSPTGGPTRPDLDPSQAATESALLDELRRTADEDPLEALGSSLGKRAGPEPSPSDDASAGGAPRISLSSAGFEELRALGLSATQARRVLAARRRREGFRSLNELDQLPGFPEELLGEIKARLTL